MNTVMKNRFVAIDLEMANNDLTSICQVGLAVFENGQLIEQWESLINPESEFGEYQMLVHGLTAQDVITSPKLHEVAPVLRDYLADQVVCSYGYTDCNALMDSLPLPRCTWTDTSLIAKSVWEYKNRRKLRDVCLDRGLTLLNAHNALADAVAAGELMVLAMTEKQLNLQQLLKFSKKMIEPSLL